MFDSEKKYSKSEIEKLFTQAQQKTFNEFEKKAKKTIKDDSGYTAYMFQVYMCLNELYYQLFVSGYKKEFEDYENKKQNKDIQI